MKIQDHSQQYQAYQLGIGYNLWCQAFPMAANWSQYMLAVHINARNRSREGTTTEGVYAYVKSIFGQQ